MSERSTHPRDAVTDDGKRLRLEHVERVHLINRVDFDRWENSLGAAITTTMIGAAASSELAEALVRKYADEAKIDEKTYKGWNDQTYPQFHVVDTPIVTGSHLDRHCSTTHAWSDLRGATPTSTGSRVCLSCGRVELVDPAEGAASARAVRRALDALSVLSVDERIEALSNFARIREEIRAGQMEGDLHRISFLVTRETLALLQRCVAGGKRGHDTASVASNLMYEGLRRIFQHEGQLVAVPPVTLPEGYRPVESSQGVDDD